ncbi:MAG: cell division protein FtsZ [Rhodospirillaceae bacterium]|nr:cell division protein FtsZ [Rhodospirillaceae bacterium]|tara:strand:+ start:3158 stop:4885 length:1728 start_codon:yes stop_codon:yes gene_type:complete
MTIDFKPQSLDEAKPRITVFGVGGAGGNAVNNMINGKLEGVDFVVANTDSQSLVQSLAEHRIQLGINITNGLGAGARPDIGKVAAEEALENIQRYLDGNNMVFIASGMGGGTGTGAAPVIARAAREQGILTVGVVTKPFQFEGLQRMTLADAGIQELQNYVDTLIVIPNQNLFRIANEHTGFAEAFKLADDVLHAGVRGVTDLMINPGLINLDFADIRTVMGEMGKAMMGTGESEGATRAVEAAEAAINNPLLDNASIEGAQGVLINITGSTDMTLHEVDEAASRICREVDENANIIFGTSIDEKLEGSMRVAVIATGIDADSARAPVPDVPNNVHVLGMPTSNIAGSGPTAEQMSEETKAEMIHEEIDSNQMVESTNEVELSLPEEEKISPKNEEVSAPEKTTLIKSKTVSASTSGGVAARVTISNKPQTFKQKTLINESSDSNLETEKAFIPAAPIDPNMPTPEISNTKSVDIISEADLLNVGKVGKKRTPSLFERMTGTGRARQETTDANKNITVKEDISDKKTDLLEGTKFQNTEPKLDISKTSTGSITSEQTSEEDDPLEIPAFLRRQAN